MNAPPAGPDPASPAAPDRDGDAPAFHDTAAAAAFREGKLGKANLFTSPRMFCDVYALLPGQEQAAHAHAANDKLYHVLSGRVTVTIGGATRELGPGELAVAAAGVPHGCRNASGAPATLLVVMAPHPDFRG